MVATYGFRLRPPHSSHVPADVKVLRLLEHPSFPVHGAAVLSRPLTDIEADHFDLVLLQLGGKA